MRTLLLELRPAALVETNLGDLLRQLGEATAGRTGVQVQVSIERYCTLPADVHVALYRIAQEALNNIAKHACAQQAAVSLRCTAAPAADRREPVAHAELEIRDDGCGFDPAHVSSDHFGLRIIRERAEGIEAEVVIHTAPGEGTLIRVVWTDKRGRHTS